MRDVGPSFETRKLVALEERKLMIGLVEMRMPQRRIVKRLSVIWALVAATGFAGLAEAQTYRVRQEAILDRNGFERPIPVGTLLLPSDWASQGSLFWQQTSCEGDSWQADWVAAGPDGTVMQLEGGVGWYMSSYDMGGMNVCRQADVRTVEDFLRAYVSITRPGAQLLSVERRSDLEQAHCYGLPQRSQTGGVLMVNWASIGQAVIGYSLDGQPMEEAFRVSIAFGRTVMADGWGGQMEFLSGRAYPFMAMRAPAGQLDLELFDFVNQSYQSNPEWVQRIVKHQQEMARINNQGAMERSRITAQHGEEMRQIIQEGFENRQAAQDRMHQNFSDAIREVTPFQDPTYGDVVELPSGYDQAWRMNDGSYVVSNNPNFDPNVDWQENAQPLQQIQR